MSLALAASGRLKPEIRLAKAVSQFEADLNGDQKATFRTQRSLALSHTPEPGDVMRLTAEVDRCASRSQGARVRCVGPRLTNILQAIQQYVGLGDILIGGSQNLIACGVWTVVRTSLLLITNHAAYLEKLSVLFMNAGRSAPRYQQMALLYPRSKTLRGNLCEYLIVVVQICHKLLLFSKKSYIGQLAASLSDSDVQQYQTELETWAAAIKEEVNLLMGQRIEDEAKENSRFRAMTSIFSETAAHRKKVKERLRVLDACSTFDHQTPWKQARKIGNTNLFVENSLYEEWRNSDSPRTFICTGKLGSGKSVLLANIIDDVNIYAEADKIPVAYFFCRHDIPESLQPRIVVGSFIRQLLSTIVDLPELYAIVPDGQELGLDSMLAYFHQVFQPNFSCYFILDGLDECTESDQKTILDYCCQLQKSLKLVLCVSFRLEADNRLQLSLGQFTSPVVWKIPDNNPEIAAFIDAELQARIIENKLAIGDPTIILEIRDALLEGAQGMFLWVALQITSLCEEKTDKRIRDALRDLPRDLSKTFFRILDRAGSHERVYQKRILQLVAVAYRPLAAEELREALSVVPGDTDWDPAKLVNDIYSILACCGSLITIDEEERTIRFVHHSVKQYLIGHFKDETPFNFDLEDANRFMGRAILTYLNYNVFDTQLSTTVIPEIRTGAAPGKIINSLDSSGKSKILALKLLKSRMKSDSACRPDYDIGHILAANSKGFRKPMGHDTFAFHPYSKAHWLIHTTSISESDAFSYRALARLVKQLPDIQAAPWGRTNVAPPHFIVKAILDSRGQPMHDLKLQVSPVTYWALKNSHLPLLRHQLKTAGAVRTIASISLSLKKLLLSSDPPIWHNDMCTQLLPFAALSSSVSLARVLLRNGASITHRGYSAISAAISGGSIYVLRLLLEGLDNPDEIKSIINGLDIDAVLVACRAGNAVLASFLVSIGADVNRFSGPNSPLYYSLYSLDVGSEFLETAKDLVEAGAKLCCLNEPFVAYTLVMNWLRMSGSTRLPDALVNHLGRGQLDRLLFDCCASNTTPETPTVVAAALECGANPEYYNKDIGTSCLSVAVLSSGLDDNSVIELLLRFGASAATKYSEKRLSVLEECLVNKNSAMVRLFLLHGLDRAVLRETISRLGLLHRRIKEADYADVEFLCAYCGADVNAAQLGPSSFGMTPLLTAINRENKKFDPFAIVLDIALRGADLDQTGYGQVLPLQAVLDRVVYGGPQVFFHQESATYLRLARCLVALGAQFEESLIIGVVELSLSLLSPTEAVELEGDCAFQTQPTNSENVRRKNLHQSPLEDSVLSLLEQLLKDLVARKPPSTRSRQSIGRLIHELFEDNNVATRHLPESLKGSSAGISYLAMSHIITIIEILVTAGGSGSHSSTLKPSSTVMGHYEKRPELFQDAGLVRLLTDNLMFWFVRGGQVSEFQKWMDVSSYLLLKHGHQSLQLGMDQCPDLPTEGWTASIRRGMAIAAAEGDVPSVRAGCQMLETIPRLAPFKMIDEAKENLQKLNQPPEEGVVYELDDTTCRLNSTSDEGCPTIPYHVVDLTTEDGPYELSASPRSLPASPTSINDQQSMSNQLPGLNKDDPKKKKNKWWRPDILSQRQPDPDLEDQARGV